MRAPFTLSIRGILIAGVGLTVVAIVVALYLGLSAAFHNTRELLTEKAETLVARMVDEIDGRLRPVEARSRRIAARVADGRLPLRSPDRESVSSFFDVLIDTTPEIGAIALIDRYGAIRQWVRGGDVVPPADWSDRVAVMDWLDAGSKKPQPQWGPPIWLDTLETAVIIHHTPLFDSEGYLGYLALAVPIEDLSRHLARISVNAFVLAGHSDVVAHPLMIDWRPLDAVVKPKNDAIYQGHSALVPLAEIGDPVLERIWSADYQDLVMLNDMAGARAVAAEVGEREYVFLYRTIEGYGSVPWNVGTYLNAASAGEVMRRLRWAIFAGFWVFVAAVILSTLLARALGRPIRSLSRAAKAVHAGRLDDVPPLPVSRITELNTAISSFKGMVAGLAERELIRRTLGRYVPEKIAEKLLEDGGGLTPTEAEATILFADIAGFTALTEALGPLRIVEVLNTYFSRMTEIIEAHGGLITQFQGDAILAIFNVPVAAPDHAVQACRAAMEMREAVDGETFSGEKLKSRIGINTGSVVAGAVGAEGRLTYTVHGDAVNRAARVEALNKEMGTSLLITEMTACLLDSIPVRRVGVTKLRGQTETVTVYTID
jgi:class 3 adenylate cyclase